MKNKYILFFLVFILSLTSCKEEGKFPVDKKYWDIKDYAIVINEIKYNSKPGDKLPTFSDSESSLILEKLTDEENFKVVLDDKELGIKHKNEVAQEFFTQWKSMSDIYTEIDRTDKYVYERELLEIWNFGLELQIKYFKLGNDAIIEKADDPNSTTVQNIVTSNTSALMNNMMIFIDEINNEKSYSEIGLNLIAESIEKNFTELIKVFPSADYDSLLHKVNLMLNKSKSESIKHSLTKIKELIESKK